MHLSEASWADVASATPDVAILPVGSTEQHGPHAPLGTDIMAAEAIAKAGAARADPETVVAPGVPVGVAAEHREFAGTLWTSEDTFRAYVGDILESMAAHGWNRTVIVNGHGGNVAPLREVCGRLVREDVLYAVSFTWFDAVDPDDVGFEGGMGHAGPIETSVMQHLDPGLVDEARFVEAAAGAAERWGEWHAGVNLAYDSDEFTESGVVGDPADGSPELGERLFELASERLAELIGVVNDRDISTSRD